jgi:serine/threonine-protein kinase
MASGSVTRSASESDDLLREMTRASDVVPSDEAPLMEGATLSHFRITSKLGKGGMGVVYAARDLTLGRTVALKVLPSGELANPERRERLLREARSASAVVHPNLATVFEVGEASGVVFIAMEHVEGRLLRAVLKEANGPLQSGEASRIAREIARGLAKAHRAGIVHRDIKPENVMILPDGGVKILDFGLAKWIHSHPSSDSLSDPSASTEMVTCEGKILGTPAYMSPEQARGRPVDLRSDVFSLGVVLYEMVTGVRPFRGGTTMEVLIAINRDTPTPARTLNPKVPATLQHVLDRALAKEPDARYAECGALGEALDQILAGLVGGPARALAGPSDLDGDHVPIVSSAEGAPAAPGARPEDRTLAVVPFRNAGAPEDDYLAEELTDDLIDVLSMTRGLRVKSRSAIPRSRGAELDPNEVGRALGVEVVVLGSVRRVGGEVRIGVRLVGVADGFQLWARRFERSEQDVLAINNETARAIASALTLDGGGTRTLREVPRDPMVIDLYIRARHEYRKFWAEPMERSIALFERALATAPDDPLLLAGMASALARRAFFVGEEGIARARAFAERAVAAAPNQGEAHLALGSVLFQVGDAEDAARVLRRAVLLSPGQAEVHAALGRLLAEAGAFAEAIPRLEAALALDPDAPLARPELMRAHALAGSWEASDRVADGLRDSEGATGFWTLRARIALWRRQPDLAERHLRQIPAANAPPTSVAGLLLEVATTRRAPEGWPAHAALSSEDAGVRRRSFRLQIAAEVAAFLGDDETARGALQVAADGGLIDLAWLERCPLFEGLRADPRYASIHGRVKRRADRILEAYHTP